MSISFWIFCLNFSLFKEDLLCIDCEMFCFLGFLGIFNVLVIFVVFIFLLIVLEFFLLVIVLFVVLFFRGLFSVLYVIDEFVLLIKECNFCFLGVWFFFGKSKLFLLVIFLSRVRYLFSIFCIVERVLSGNLMVFVLKFLEVI